MKKFVAILLCLVMVLAIVACKKTETKTETPADTKTETTEAKKLQVVNLVNGNLGDKSFFDSAESGMKALADAGLVEYKTIRGGGRCFQEVRHHRLRHLADARQPDPRGSEVPRSALHHL